MQSTPIKKINSNFHSLKQQIKTRIKSENKNTQKRQNKTKKCQSHKKSSFMYIPSYFDSLNPLQSSPIDIQNQQKNNKNNSINKEKSRITEQNILEYQSLQNPHFFGYQQWLEFNNKYFGHVQDKIINNFWKIIRIINYGDVFVPSGLIFEISKYLSQSQVKNSYIDLKIIFNQFLCFNKKKDQVQNFRQLKMYPSIKQIQNSYLRKFNQQKQNQNHSKNQQKHYSCKKSPKGKQKLNQIFQKKTFCDDKNVFLRVYDDSKIRKTNRNSQIYQGLIQKQSNKQCMFAPQINQYRKQKLFIEQSCKPDRICQSTHKLFSKRQYLQDLLQNKNFKASEFNRSIFENKQLEQIPGVRQHLSRKQHYECQKRKIQRFLQKPTKIFKHY